MCCFVFDGFNMSVLGIGMFFFFCLCDGYLFGNVPMLKAAVLAPYFHTVFYI